MRILIACSSGGHLAQALALEPWWGEHERLWVTGPTEDARLKLRDERVIECAWPTQRNLPNPAQLDELFAPKRNSTGAAVAVPFLRQARRVGARSIFLETIDRIDKPSLTGRLVYPFVDEYLTQWDQLTEKLPRAQTVGLVL